MMTPTEKRNLRRKWKRWLERIGHDLGWLLTSHGIFEEIQSVVKSNDNIQSPTLLYRWMCDNYAARAAIGLRRLSDHDTRTVSLYRLIKNISENPQGITRDYYVSQYPERMQEMDLADHDFDNFANKNSNLVSVSRLQTDMKRLKKGTERIRKFADKWIAHCDLNRVRTQVPTYKEVGEALRNVDRLYCKYFLLITRGGMSTRKPVIQYDWKEPLTHPWIEISENKKRYRLKNGLPVWDKRPKG